MWKYDSKEICFFLKQQINGVIHPIHVWKLLMLFQLLCVSCDPQPVSSQILQILIQKFLTDKGLAQVSPSIACTISVSFFSWFQVHDIIWIHIISVPHHILTLDIKQEQRQKPKQTNWPTSYHFLIQNPPLPIWKLSKINKTVY